MQSIPPWIWPAAAWTLLAFAVWLFAAPWFRRYPGRWCHRCGYDMSGLATLTCPECGRTARNERDLSRRPARKLRRSIAIILALAAWPLAHLPRTVERGPVALAPDWLLARTAPITGTSFDTTAVMSRRATFGGAFPLPGQPQTIGERLKSALYIETWSRLEADELGDSAASTYLTRVCAAEPAPSVELSLPKAWPSDRELAASTQYWSPYFTTSGRSRPSSSFFRLAPSVELRPAYTPGGAPLLNVRATVGSRTYLLAPRPAPIDVSTPADRFMTPVSSPEVDKAIARMLYPRIHVLRGTAKLSTGGVSPSLPGAKLPFYGYFRFTILLDDTPIGTGTGGWAGEAAMPIEITWQPGSEAQAAANANRLMLDITSEPKDACRAYLLDWSQPRTAWSGKARLKPAPDYGDR